MAPNVGYAVPVVIAPGQTLVDESIKPGVDGQAAAQPGGERILQSIPDYSLSYFKDTTSYVVMLSSSQHLPVKTDCIFQLRAADFSDSGQPISLMSVIETQVHVTEKLCSRTLSW